MKLMTRFLSLMFILGFGVTCVAHDDLTANQLELVKKIERQRIETINKVIGSVIAIYGEERQGGGSGVIIDPSGIGLTNHHVIQGAGVKGWGGLADGNLYRWDLIGTDPGGDVAIIQMKGKDEWPFTPLADSDRVQVGDWALAMGNPFVLTEDQAPTVTLGIVSGVKRYQPGAGMNQLVYGNCIQTDSSINPGNSGGPLFNLEAKVIGINGRGSFKERGRVNVGLGYAISSNQIKNFIPDLLATKLVEHGTLDANFEDRDGKVVCSQVYEDSGIYKAGLRPGDQLLEFEGETILTANQFTNLICTLPEDWPARLLIGNSEGEEKVYHTRLYGLPYAKPQQPPIQKEEKDQTPEEKEQIARAKEMIDLLSADPGKIRHPDRNSKYANHMVAKWRKDLDGDAKNASWEISDRIMEDGKQIGKQLIRLHPTGNFEVERTTDKTTRFRWNGKKLIRDRGDQTQELSLVETKLCVEAIQALGMIGANGFNDLQFFGDLMLDGSDKAASRNSYRMKLVDTDEDSFYFWLSMEDKAAQQEQVVLLKASGDKNCDQEPGGVVFQDWRVQDGLAVAKTRNVVVGIEESVQRTYELDSIRRIASPSPESIPE